MVPVYYGYRYTLKIIITLSCWWFRVHLHFWNTKGTKNSPLHFKSALMPKRRIACLSLHHSAAFPTLHLHNFLWYAAIIRSRPLLATSWGRWTSILRWCGRGGMSHIYHHNSKKRTKALRHAVHPSLMHYYAHSMLHVASWLQNA